MNHINMNMMNSQVVNFLITKNESSIVTVMKTNILHKHINCVQMKTFVKSRDLSIYIFLSKHFNFKFSKEADEADVCLLNLINQWNNFFNILSLILLYCTEMSAIITQNSCILLDMINNNCDTAIKFMFNLKNKLFCVAFLYYIHSSSFSNNFKFNSICDCCKVVHSLWQIVAVYIFLFKSSL